MIVSIDEPEQVETQHPEDPSAAGSSEQQSAGTRRTESLEELVQIEGVVAAIEWAEDGSLIDYRSSIDLSAGLAAGAAQFQRTITITFDKLSESFSQLSGMNWAPQQAWAYSGGDWSIVVGGQRGVFVETAKADFNDLFRRLAGA